MATSRVPDRPATLPAQVVWKIWLIFSGGALYQILLAVSRGAYRLDCILASTLVIAAALTASCLPVGGRSKSYRGLVILFTVGAVIQCVAMRFFPVWRDAPGNLLGLLTRWSVFGATVIGNVAIGVAACGVTAVMLACYGRHRAAAAAIGLAALVHVVGSFWVFDQLPAPNIDVWEFHRDARTALAAGINPYAITYPNVYYDIWGDHSPLFPPGLQKNGRVLTGYPYPPLCLLINYVGGIFDSDVRYTMTACFALAAAFIGLISRGPLSKLAAIFFLLAPATLEIEHCAWTEPQMLLALVGVVLLGTRNSRALPVMLGLFFALKQYTFIYAPLVFLILPRPLSLRSSTRFVAVILTTAAVVTLPLALWKWDAFWRSTVTFHLMQSFRDDSFSLIAVYARHFASGSIPPQWIGFAIVVPTWVLLTWRLQRNAAGFALGVGVITAVFLTFSRQAFLNYHTFAADALLISAAAFEAIYRQAGDAPNGP